MFAKYTIYNLQFTIYKLIETKTIICANENQKQIQSTLIKSKTSSYRTNYVFNLTIVILFVCEIVYFCLLMDYICIVYVYCLMKDKFFSHHGINLFAEDSEGVDAGIYKSNTLKLEFC